MKRLAIDFAPRSVRRAVFHTHPLAWLLAAVALAAALAAGFAGWTLSEQKKAYEAEAAKLRQRSAHPVAAAEQANKPRIPEAQANAVNAAIMQLNLPWRALQDAVASATTPAVALLSLEPDARRHTLKITAEARNSDDMIGYIEALKKEELFTGVNLLRHEVNENDPNRPLRFQIDAQWRTP